MNEQTQLNTRLLLTDRSYILTQESNTECICKGLERILRNPVGILSATLLKEGFNLAKYISAKLSNIDV